LGHGLMMPFSAEVLSALGPRKHGQSDPVGRVPKSGGLAKAKLAAIKTMWANSILIAHPSFRACVKSHEPSEALDSRIEIGSARLQESATANASPRRRRVQRGKRRLLANTAFPSPGTNSRRVLRHSRNAFSPGMVQRRIGIEVGIVPGCFFQGSAGV